VRGVGGSRGDCGDPPRRLLQDAQLVVPYSKDAIQAARKSRQAGRQAHSAALCLLAVSPGRVSWPQGGCTGALNGLLGAQQGS